MAVLLNKHDVVSAHDLDRIKALSSPPPTYTPERVAQIRIKKAKMSQSVFAGFVNVTTSTVQIWESPASGKHPGGAAASAPFSVDMKHYGCNTLRFILASLMAIPNWV